MQSQHNHAHSNPTQTNQGLTRRITIAMLVTLVFVFVEAAAGVIGNSLALLSDAGHNLTDVLALGLSWYALRLSARPADRQKTFGYHRSGILVALFNSTTLILVAGYIFFEAFQRFRVPPEVDSDILVGVGLVALLINAGTAWLIHGGSQHDLNLRSTFIHLMGDVLSTLGAVAAGLAIRFTGLNWLDPLVSVLIGLLILWNARLILAETIDILMESTPADVDTDRLVQALMAVDGVRGVHDLHVWSTDKRSRYLSAHILTEDISISQGAEIQNALNDILCERFDIGHATLQLEAEDCAPGTLYCNGAARTPH